MSNTKPSSLLAKASKYNHGPRFKGVCQCPLCCALAYAWGKSAQKVGA